MAILKLEYQLDDYESLQEGELSIKEFLNEVLFSGSYTDVSPEDQVLDLLLAYHASEGTSPEISDLELEEVEYDEEEETGKANFSYIVEYQSTCSGANSEHSITETVDFAIGEEPAEVIFTFMELTTPSTADEF